MIKVYSRPGFIEPYYQTTLAAHKTSAQEVKLFQRKRRLLAARALFRLPPDLIEKCVMGFISMPEGEHPPSQGTPPGTPVGLMAQAAIDLLSLNRHFWNCSDLQVTEVSSDHQVSEVRSVSRRWPSAQRISRGKKRRHDSSSPARRVLRRKRDDPTRDYLRKKHRRNQWFPASDGSVTMKARGSGTLKAEGFPDKSAHEKFL